MSIQEIKTNDLRRMKDREGLILQGCGGDPQEWLDGINDLLTKEGILLNGSRFETCYSFKNGDTTCLLFPFDGLKIQGGKFAVWRIATHDTFGGTWLSDYVPDRLGGFIDAETTEEQTQKPDCPLIGQDGNIFNLMGIAAKTLRQSGLADQAREMTHRITETAHSYDDALGIIGEYVNITSVDDEEESEDYEEGMEMSL